MKKLLSVILALSLLLSGLVITTSAAGNKLTLGSETKCNYTSETLVYTFTPTKDVLATLYTKDNSAESDTCLTVYCEDDYDYYGFSDDEDENYNFCYTDLFKAGLTYIFEISEYWGNESEFTLVLTEYPVESIEVTNIPTLSVDIMGNIEAIYEGITVTLSFNNQEQTEKTVVFDYDNTVFVNGYALSLNYEQDLETSETSLLVSYMGYTETYPVETDAKTVTGFELITPPRGTTLYKDIDCMETLFLDEETMEIATACIYNVYYFGACARVYYEDETFTDINYDDNSMFFQTLESNIDDQLKNPWDIGTHTVTVSYQGFTDSFDVELIENPYVKAEITKAPTYTKSTKSGLGEFIYGDIGDIPDNSEYEEKYFYYDTPLEGIEVTLTDKNGNKTIVRDDADILLKLRAKTDQETNAWKAGEHSVEVYYGNMFVGTYTYTVTGQYVAYIEIIEEAEAFYYRKTGEIEFSPDNLSVSVTVMEPERQWCTDYKDFEYNENGTAMFVDIGYDETEDNYYYYVYSHTDSGYIHSSPIYFETVYREVTYMEIVSPPASLTYINGYGLDIYNMDLSGLEVAIHYDNEDINIWRWDKSEKDYSEVFSDGILYIDIYSEFISITYRGNSVECYPENYKSIDEYSKDVIDKNTTLEIDLNKPEMFVYTFTPWVDGIYNFTVEGKPISILGIFDEYSTLHNAVLYEEQFLTNIKSETFTMECHEGETYFLLIEKLDLFGEPSNGTIDFTVDIDICGDADGDGEITTKDVLAIRKYLAGIIEEDALDLSACDVDKDGDVSTKDVLAVRKYLAGLITELPFTGE